MKTAVIIVEQDVLEKPLYFGKSGDLAIIDFFLRKDWQVVLINAHDMQKKNFLPTHGFLVQYKDYTETFYQSMINECHNIVQGKTPATNAEGLGIKLSLTDTLLSHYHNFLLLSRAMPQSISGAFLANFNILAQQAQHVAQSMEEIALYKDKAIPYLLQSNEANIKQLYKIYSADCKIFKEHVGEQFKELSLRTTVIDTSLAFEELYGENIQGKVCMKPFNLFGGEGVKIFNDVNQKEEMQKHLGKIEAYFDKYNVNEQRLVLVQEAVFHPEFGDVRALFSFGKFLGAFKRFECHGQIHNTMHGGVIIPICNKEMEFYEGFEEQYRKPIQIAIKQLKELNKTSIFLRNEFVCGYDLLLTEGHYELQFKLTETNLPCPTGFAFLDCSLIVTQYASFDINQVKDYFAFNKRTIDVIMENLLDDALQPFC